LLRLSGNSEQAFAGRDSIQAQPVVYSEWNYNNIERPYVVSSVASGKLLSSSVLLNATAWTSTAGSGQLIPGAGLVSTTDPTANAILLNTGSANDMIYTSQSVPVVTAGSAYYKFVFYVKANQPVISTAASAIASSSILGGGLLVHSPVNVATTSTLNATYSSGSLTSINNGTLTIDGVSLSTSNRVLVKNQSSPIQNGIYTVSAPGGAGSKWTLTRSTDNNTSASNTFGDAVEITSGTTNAGTFWVQTNYGSSTASGGAINVGTDSITWYSYPTSFPSTFLSSTSDNRANYSSSSYTFPYNPTYDPTYPASSTYSYSGQIVYYRIIPLNPNGSHPPKDSSGLDIQTVYVKNNSASGGLITWPNSNNAIAYNIYRGYSPTNLYYLATVPATTGQNNYYVDNYYLTPNAVEASPVQSTNIRIIPSVNMSLGGNPVEYNDYFVKIYTDPFSDPDINRGVVSIDGVNYQKVEVFFGSSAPFDSFTINIDVNSVYQNASIYLYRPEIYQIDQWSFYQSQYYPIESLFNANRPGEALLNPFLQQKDRQINSTSLGSNIIKTKPISYVAYNPDHLYGNIQPYKQFSDSTLNNVIRFYVGPTTGVAGDYATAQIFANYNNYMNVNKIVLKGSNAFSDLTQSSGSVTLLTATGNIVIPFGSLNGSATFDASGLLVLYYNGTGWQTTYPSTNYYPPKLTNSGILQNIVQNVSGMSLTINNVGPGNSNSISSQANTRVQLIEFSPRLEIDISDHIVGIEVDQTIDNSNSANGFPIGYINSNTAKITIDNIPVYKDNFPHTMWEPFSTNNATFSNLVRQNVKFTGALKSLSGDFTDTVPLFCMYSNDWQINNLQTIEVDVFDYTKAIMMVVRSPDYFGSNENMFSTVTNIFDSVGFSDYDYDGLNAIMSRRATNTTHFWCDRTNDLYDAIRGFFVAHQIGAWFDPYGIMRFEDLDSIIAKYYSNTQASFMVTDIDYEFTNQYGSSIKYSPNIVQNTLNTQVNPKIGLISLDYQVPLRAFTFGLNSENNSTQQEQPYTLWSDTGNDAVVFSFADRSVTSTDNYFYSNPERTNMMSPNTTPRYTLGGESGVGFLQGELVEWSGLEYNFVPVRGQATSVLTPVYSSGFNEIVTTPADVQNYINYFSTQDDSITQVKFNFTGNAVGLLRGQRYTSVRNHYLFHSNVPKAGYNSSINNYWNRYVVTPGSYTTTSNTVYNPAGSDVLFNDNVAILTLNRNLNGGTYPVGIGPVKVNGLNDIGELNVPKSASSFNYFSFLFGGPNFKDISKKKWSGHDAAQVQAGIHIDTTKGPLVLVLENYENRTYLKTGINSVYALNTPDGMGVPVAVRNVYDGLAHRLTAVFSNTKSYFSPAQPSSTISYKYVTIFVDGYHYGPYELYGEDHNPATVFPQTQFGFVGAVVGGSIKSGGKATSSNSYKINLYEIYSCLWFADKGVYIKPSTNPWHWQCKYFLDGLIGNDPTIEPPYFFWGRNQIVGAKFYDNVQFTTSPAYPNSISYEYAGYDPGLQPGKSPTLGRTSGTSISESTLTATPFRGRFAVVNSDSELVFLSTADNQVNNGQFAPFQIQGFYNKVTDSVTIEKVIDSNNILNTIQLQSQWIQSNYDAEQLMIKLALLSHAFNAQMTITVFGNPLIQVGDVCQMIYTQKNIGFNPGLITSTGTNSDVYGQIVPTYFYVTGTVQKWGNDQSTGLETDLTLIPMTYLPS
jgi:hypothetical protein